MDSLLDTSSGSAEGCYSHGSALEEQRRYAEVASDLARSPAFMAVLLESGRLGTFLRKAVGVLTRAAIKRIFRNPNVVLPQNYMGGGARRTRAGGDREGTRNAAARSVCDPSPPEPLLRALSSFCLEHSPARSTFIEALLAKALTERQPQAFRSKNERKMADDVDGALNKDVDPLTALFALCLDPHPPTAVASSALLQCLLVGGGALGAVSGPSPGAAAGVGIIPAAYPMASARGAGVAVGGGVGREDPLQAKLLERIAKISLYGAQPANEKDGRGSSSRHGSRRRRAAGVERESDSTDGGGGYAPTASPYRDNRKEREGENDDYPGGGSSGSGSEDEAGANRRYGETEDSICGDLTAEFAGLDLDSGRRSSSSSKGSITGTLQSPFLPGAALALVVCRLQHLGVDLASALANERGESGPVSLRGAMGPAVDDVQRRVKFAGEGGGEGRRGGGANSGKSLLRSSVVEAEQEATSLLCLLSSLVRMFLVCFVSFSMHFCNGLGICSN